MKKLILILVFTITACSNNPVMDQVIMQTIMEQATVRYIEKGSDKRKRAKDLIYVVNEVYNEIEGNPATTSDLLLKIATEKIKWESLTLADKMLVDNLLTLVKLQLQEKQNENLISKETKIKLKNIFETSIRVALYYDSE